jgi:Spy/CpxP family protein refolding chaperone
MKMLSTVLAVSALLMVGIRLAAYQEKTEVVMVETIQDLNLTDEQEAKIADIVKDFKAKNADALKELTSAVKDETEKVNAVLTPEQRDKLATLKEERKETREECLAHRIAHLKELDLTEDELNKIEDIRKEFRPKIVKAMKGLEGLLSDEQKKAREEGLKAGKKRAEILASLKFTDEQKQKVAAVCKELAPLVREEAEKIRDVLSASQKEQLQELKDERKEHVRDRLAHRIANLKDLNLTDEQKTKLADIRKEFRPKIQEAGNKLRAGIREEMEMILGVIKG